MGDYVRLVDDSCVDCQGYRERKIFTNHIVFCWGQETPDRGLLLVVSFRSRPESARILLCFSEVGTYMLCSSLRLVHTVHKSRLLLVVHVHSVGYTMNGNHRVDRGLYECRA